MTPERLEYLLNEVVLRGECADISRDELYEALRALAENARLKTMQLEEAERERAAVVAEIVAELRKEARHHPPGACACETPTYRWDHALCSECKGTILDRTAEVADSIETKFVRAQPHNAGGATPLAATVPTKPRT